jgi:hypothetical protein
MKYGVIFPLMILSAFLYGIVGLGAEVEIALEAELADEITEPMMISDDKLASDGKFIWDEGPPVEGGGGAGYAEFIINIPEPGDYALWGHVIAWDGNSDSFWVTWQPADPDEDAQATQNTQFRWGVAQGAAWHWDRINHWLDGGTFEREWKFKKAGETVLRIGVREDATMLDAIFVTTNVKATAPDQANVRLPTDKDRKIQIEGLAVDAKGKAATTWGSLKQVYQ